MTIEKSGTEGLYIFLQMRSICGLRTAVRTDIDGQTGKMVLKATLRHFTAIALAISDKPCFWLPSGIINFFAINLVSFVFRGIIFNVRIISPYFVHFGPFPTFLQFVEYKTDRLQYLIL